MLRNNRHKENVSLREIDLVYLYVDRNDPSWKAKFDHTLPLFPDTPRWASCDARFDAHDDLRFSLRSADRFLPFIRHIYIISDGQIPEWLEEAHPKIKMVSHHDLFQGVAALPLFNSHAIEAYIHRIPDLSEYFIYSNDDMFFGAPCTADDFFTEQGTARVRLQTVTCRGQSAFSKQWLYTEEKIRRLLPKRFQTHANSMRDRFARVIRLRGARLNPLAHVAQPLRKSVLEESVSRFPDELAALFRTPFRRADHVLWLWFVHYVAISRRKAVPIWSDDWHAVMKSAPLIQLRRLAHRLRESGSSGYRLLCFNDGSVRSKYDWHGEVRRYLAELLPDSSGFERLPMLTRHSG